MDLSISLLNTSFLWVHHARSFLMSRKKRCYKEATCTMAGNVNQNQEYTRDMLEMLIFSQDPILDLEISGEESDRTRSLATAQQEAQEWPGMVILTNEVGGEAL